MADVACITAAAPGRPSQFLDRCRFYVERCRDQYSGTIEHFVHEGPSLADNLRTLVEEVDARYIAIFEDDDWYSDMYLNHMLYCIKHADVQVAGVNPTLYYHIRTRKLGIILTEPHCSMFTTFGKADVLREAVRMIPDSLVGAGVDMWLWKHLRNRYAHVVTTVVPVTVGIKHGFGPSYGVGHQMHHPMYKYTIDRVADIMGPEDLEYYHSLADTLQAQVPNNEEARVTPDTGMIDVM